MAFAQALSGLNTAAFGLDVVGNNLANASTVGFKNSRPEFSDIFASYQRGAAGHGAFTTSAAQQFSQGSLATTNNSLDFAISGSGMFVLANNSADAGQRAYSRNGQFHLEPIKDANGVVTGESYLQSLSGHYPLGWSADNPTGDPAPIKLPSSILGNATTSSELSFNLNDAAEMPTSSTFNINDPFSYTWSTSQEIFTGVTDDQEGHQVDLYFVKTATSNTWSVYTVLDGNVATQTGPQTLAFTAAGALVPGQTLSATGAVTAKVPDQDGVLQDTPTTLSISVDVTGSTQYAYPSEVNASKQDGYLSGRLSTVSVGPYGRLMGNYSNGKSGEIAAIALADFKNYQGLRSLGDNLWADTPETGGAEIFVGGQYDVPTNFDRVVKVGDAYVWKASERTVINPNGKNSLGTISSSMLEESNVDIAAQLLDMITFQRNYQANAQMIKAQDEVLRTLAALR